MTIAPYSFHIAWISSLVLLFYLSFHYLFFKDAAANGKESSIKNKTLIFVLIMTMILSSVFIGVARVMQNAKPGYYEKQRIIPIKDGQSITVGNSIQSDVSLQNPNMAPVHAEFKLAGDSIVIKNLAANRKLLFGPYDRDLNFWRLAKGDTIRWDNNAVIIDWMSFRLPLGRIIYLTDIYSGNTDVKYLFASPRLGFGGIIHLDKSSNAGWIIMNEKLTRNTELFIREILILFGLFVLAIIVTVIARSKCKDKFGSNFSNFCKSRLYFITIPLIIFLVFLCITYTACNALHFNTGNPHLNRSVYLRLPPQIPNRPEYLSINGEDIAARTTNFGVGDSLDIILGYTHYCVSCISDDASEKQLVLTANEGAARGWKEFDPDKRLILGYKHDAPDCQSDCSLGKSNKPVQIYKSSGSFWKSDLVRLKPEDVVILKLADGSESHLLFKSKRAANPIEIVKYYIDRYLPFAGLETEMIPDGSIFLKCFLIGFFFIVVSILMMSKVHLRNEAILIWFGVSMILGVSVVIFFSLFIGRYYYLSRLSTHLFSIIIGLLLITATLLLILIMVKKRKAALREIESTKGKLDIFYKELQEQFDWGGRIDLKRQMMKKISDILSLWNRHLPRIKETASSDIIPKKIKKIKLKYFRRWRNENKINWLINHKQDFNNFQNNLDKYDEKKMRWFDYGIQSSLRFRTFQNPFRFPVEWVNLSHILFFIILFFLGLQVLVGDESGISLGFGEFQPVFLILVYLLVYFSFWIYEFDLNPMPHFNDYLPDIFLGVSAFLMLLFLRDMSPLLILFILITAIFFIRFRILYKNSGIIQSVPGWLGNFISSKTNISPSRMMKLAFIAICLLMAAIVLVFAFSNTTISERINIWLDPYSTTLASGQYLRSADMISSGGLFGNGLATTNDGFGLSEIHEEFVFALLANEMGLIGVILIMSIISLISLIVLKFIAIRDENYKIPEKIEKERDLCRNLLGLIVLLNLIISIITFGTVSGFTPIIGLPAPYLSIGGSAMIFYSFLILSLIIWSINIIKKSRVGAQTA